MNILGVSISKVNRTGETPTPDQIKDLDAGLLAQGLLNIFGVSVCIAFCVLCITIVGALFRPGSTNLGVVPMFKEALEILRLVGAMFSPLLAFVLGYYFNQSAKTAGAAAGAAAGQTAGSQAGMTAGAAAGAKAAANIQSGTDPGQNTNSIDSATNLAKLAGTVAGAQAGADAGGEAGAEAAGVVESILHPSPILESLNPVSVPAGSENVTLTVNGQGFVSDSTIQINGDQRTTTFVSDKQLRAIILPADVAETKTHIVTVVNPGQNNNATQSINWEVTG